MGPTIESLSIAFFRLPLATVCPHCSVARSSVVTFFSNSLSLVATWRTGRVLDPYWEKLLVSMLQCGLSPYGHILQQFAFTGRNLADWPSSRPLMQCGCGILGHILQCL